MPVAKFIAMLILAVLGVVVFFAKEVLNAVRYDCRTPTKFNFGMMFKMSALRIFIGLIIIPVAVVYFGEMSQMIFQIHEPLEINGFVAFMLGMGIDRLVDGVIGYGKEGKHFLNGKS